MGATTSTRIGSLDGLRGVAALVVVIHHSLLVIPALADHDDPADTSGPLAWLIYSPLHVLWGGTEAVYVFFILSGLVLTLPVLRNSRFSWKAYFPSRLVRLYVPVVGAVLFALVLIFVFAGARVALVGQSMWLQDHIESVTFTSVLQNAVLLLGTDNLNSPLWSLRWEVVFSILLPLYIWVAVRMNRVWWLLVLGSVALTSVGTGLGQATLIYLPMFMIGCVIANRLSELQRLAHKIGSLGNASLLWWILLAAAVLGISSRWWLSPLMGDRAARMTIPIVVAASALVVLLAICSPRVRALLERPIPKWIGAVSFSLYLTHEPVVVTVAFLLPTSHLWLTPVIAIPVALAVAAGFHRWVETPAYDLAKRVATIATRPKIVKPRGDSPLESS